MDARVYNLELDIKKRNIIEYIEVVQGDNRTNVFNIALKNDTEPYLLTDTIVLVAFNKPDRTQVTQSSLDAELPITIEDNVAICTLKTNSIAAQGRVLAEVRVSDLSGKVLTSQRFYFLVRKPLFSDDTIKSTDEFPLLEKILGDEAQRKENELLRQEGEANRNTDYAVAESDRNGLYEDAEVARNNLYAGQESDRNTNYDAAEGTRSNSYNQAETSRDGEYGQAETARDGLYDLAEEGRNDLYGEAEDNRDDKYDIAEVGRAEQLNNIESDLATHKEDYATQRQLPHFDHVKQEYINLDKFWDNLRDGKIYTSEFNQYNVSPASTGIKKDDNLNLVCEPSTNTIRGRNDYSKIGLFKSIDVNAYVDDNDDYHVTAMKGDGRFKNDGTMGDVYVMAMVGYQKRYSNDTVWGISYSDTMHPGFEILDEAVKPDDTIRPYLLHAKHGAGRNKHENNNLASISGVPLEHSGMSNNGQIDKFKDKGIQYSGKTTHDDYYIQLMMWLKYATTNNEDVMRGCSSYYLQYTNLTPENNVNKVVLTNSQANALVIGSTVSIGDFGDGSIITDRTLAQNYNLADRVNILNIVDLGDGNSAIYVDSEPFNTTLSTTITTYPWNTGGCDDVLGQDGSPWDNMSRKEPFLINGIEVINGGYEVIVNLIIHNNSADDRTDVYVCYDCTKYNKSSPNEDYDLVGQIVSTENVWKYGSKIKIHDEHPSAILVTEAEATSTTGTGDGVYTNSPSTGGYRVWLSLGHLNRGAHVGLRCLGGNRGLAVSGWDILGRLSATGRSRRRAGVN